MKRTERMPPLCADGCGGYVNWNVTKKCWSTYISGHNIKWLYGAVMPKSAKKKIAKSQEGSGNSYWNGGETISHGGYVTILKPEHPFRDVNKRVKEERLVVEKNIGRYLTKDEIIHHRNRIKTDNRLCNLQIVSRSEHSKIHWEDRRKKHES